MHPKVVPEEAKAREPEPVLAEPFAATFDDSEAVKQPLLNNSELGVTQADEY